MVWGISKRVPMLICSVVISKRVPMLICSVVISKCVPMLICSVVISKSVPMLICSVVNTILYALERLCVIFNAIEYVTRKILFMRCGVESLK